MGKCYGSGWQTVQEYTIYHKQCYLSNTTHLHIVHGWHFNINLHKNTFAVDTLQCASDKYMHQDWATICVKKYESSFKIKSSLMTTRVVNDIHTFLDFMSIGKLLYNFFLAMRKIPLSVNQILFRLKCRSLIGEWQSSFKHRYFMTS